MNGSILPPSRKFKAEDMAEAMLRSNVRAGTTVTKTTRCYGVGLGSPTEDMTLGILQEISQRSVSSS